MAASPTTSSSSNNNSRVVVRGAGARLRYSARASQPSHPHLTHPSLHLCCAGLSTGVAVGAGVLGGMLMADMLFD